VWMFFWVWGCSLLLLLLLLLLLHVCLSDGWY
jgi:hypothetical protein